MRLYDLQFPTDKKYLEHVRDVFCFCAFTSLCYSDVSNLKRSDVHGDYITVVTEKTDKALNIDLNNKAKAILDKYKNMSLGDMALPVVSNQKSNEYIKECCFLAGINEQITITFFKGNKRMEEVHPKYELVSMHAARRTFVCAALSMGISPQTIMSFTGHSDYKSMLPYIDVASEEKRKAMDKFNSL